VNADFLLSASRESYRRDHPWNNQIESNLLSLLSLSARALAKVPPSSMLVDPLQLVPIAMSVKWMHQEIVEQLKQEPMVPVFRRAERACGAQCGIIPWELHSLEPWKELPHDFPHPFIVDRKLSERFAQQRDLVGVQNESKPMLEDIIRAQLDGRSPDPEFYRELYICMAQCFPAWTASNTSNIPNFILLEDQQQVASYPREEIYIWPCAEWWPAKDPVWLNSMEILSKYCHSSVKVASRALPSKEGNTSVRSWLQQWNIVEVDSEIAVTLCTRYLREEECTAAEVVEATIAMLRCDQKKSSLVNHSIPLVCQDGSIKKPPFNLQVVKNCELMELFGESDRGNFHLMSSEYDIFPEYSAELGRVFSIRPPPLPSTFSWMSSKSLNFTEHFSKLFLKLLKVTTCLIPKQIKHFLDTKPWMPSTMGFRVPNEVYCPTPELRDIFGTSVAYCTDSIYGIYIYIYICLFFC
jgi:hypothetical protein